MTLRMTAHQPHLTQSFLLARNDGESLGDRRILNTVQFHSALSVVVVFEVAAEHKDTGCLSSTEYGTTHLLYPSLSCGFCESFDELRVSHDIHVI